MKQTTKKLFSKIQNPEPVMETADQSSHEIAKDDRRSFLKKAAIGGLSLGAFSFAPIEKTLGYTTHKINRYSAPSDLKITDMRIADFEICPILKIYTNQGVYGLGDVRDGADKRYALELKSRILGMNPCNVEMIFKKIKQFGGPSRQAGGVCAVEMALWDIIGKVYNIPVYQCLGGKYRDQVRIYCDTTATEKTPDGYAKKMKERLNMGFTWLKMDMGIELLKDVPNALVNADFWEKQQGGMNQWGDNGSTSFAQTKHPFTAVQITPKGIDYLAQFAADVRAAVGYDVPLCTDHWGHIGVNEALKLTKAMEPYDLAWMEDLIPWFYTEQWKQITDSTTTPTLTGEDCYLLSDFKPLIDNHAVDIIHPDINSSGGILETKKIGDYAEDNGIAMALHHYATPISYMASVHVAAATQNFLALEDNGIYYPYWDDLVKGVSKPIINKGYVQVPEKPGLGVELNDEVVKQHLIKGGGFFEPTPEWDTLRSWDRTYS
ncbi:MAG: mandelate racemase/muconate lactonizing enzyme family protein [Ginsengibacter sp.]